MNLIPSVIEKTSGVERVYDIYSRLLKDRIIFIGGEINDEVANAIISELLFLDSQSNDEISIYINSPGGSITSGMAIYDTMGFVKSPISTICIGMAASMASVLLASGDKGKRFILPNSEVMIHQPLGGVSGQATEIKIYSDHMMKTREKLNKLLSEKTGQPIEVINRDTERDNYMTAQEALEYGLIDGIMDKRR